MCASECNDVVLILACLPAARHTIICYCYIKFAWNFSSPDTVWLCCLSGFCLFYTEIGLQIRTLLLALAMAVTVMCCHKFWKYLTKKLQTSKPEYLFVIFCSRRSLLGHCFLCHCNRFIIIILIIASIWCSIIFIYYNIIIITIMKFRERI